MRRRFLTAVKSGGNTVHSSRTDGPCFLFSRDAQVFFVERQIEEIGYFTIGQRAGKNGVMLRFAQRVKIQADGKDKIKVSFFAENKKERFFTMKKFLAVLLAVCTMFVLGAALTGCGDDKITIAVLQFARHGSLDNCYEGLKAGLAEEGYGEDKVKFDLVNAESNTDNNVLQAQTLINKAPKIAVGIATPSAYALAQAAEGDIPVVYTAVSDPVASGFDAFENIAGTSDKLPVAKQLELIRSFFPEKDTIKVGIIFTKSESNSEAQIKEFRALAADYSVEILAEGVTNGNEIGTVANKLIDTEKVDCVNNLTDNTVVQNMNVILSAAEGKIPVFGSEIEQVKLGCLASCSLDYYKLGIETGKIAARILKGEKADDIGCLTLDEKTGYGIDFNQAVAESLGLTLPSQYEGVANLV